MSRVFRVQHEVGHMPGTQLPIDCAGAIVNVYVGAVTLREALDISESQLLEDRYRPIDIESAYELDLENTGFDTEGQGYPGNDDLDDLRKNGGHWYGPFYTFPAEDQNNGEQDGTYDGGQRTSLN